MAIAETMAYNPDPLTNLVGALIAGAVILAIFWGYWMLQIPLQRYRIVEAYKYHLVLKGLEKRKITVAELMKEFKKKKINPLDEADQDYGAVFEEGK